ncbi:hypothetical protein ACROYT_G030266 [Oculina patagonica]
MAEQPFTVKKVLDHDNVYMCREKFFDSPNQANIWLVQGSSQDLVIDTGLGLWDLPGFLKQQNLIGDKPVTAVATHIHFDHSGGLHQFENFAIHSLEAEAIRKGDNYETVTIFTSAAEISVPPQDEWDIRDYKVKSAEPFKVLEEGDVFDLGDRKLRVLHFPGHSRGSIGLIDEEARILFTGDTMYDGYLIDWLPYSDITVYVQTCRRLQELSSQVDHVFPGHNDHFDGKRLMTLATDYITSAGACHKVSSTFMKGVASMVLKAKHSGNIPAKCCYHACCCCCCLT